MKRSEYEERLQQLRALGFPESKCKNALKKADGNVDIAADYLFQERPSNIPGQNSHRGSADVPHSQDLHKKPNSLRRDERLDLLPDRQNRYERDSDSRDSNLHQSSKRGSTSYKMGSRKMRDSNHYVNSSPVNPYLNSERQSPELVSNERERINADRSRVKSDHVYSRAERGRPVTDRSNTFPALGLEDIQFYKPHMSLEAARRLKIGDSIDHRDEVGKSLKSRIKGFNQENKKFIIHYEGWADKWDTESSPVNELWRFSEYKTLSERQVYRKDLEHLGNGDMIDINPRKHRGWTGGTIRRRDISKKTGKRISGQVQVRYKAEDTTSRSQNQKPKFKDYLYWVHLDNPDEVAPFPTKSAPNSVEEIVNTHQNNQWLEVKIRNKWEPAHVIEVRGNLLTVQCERWNSKWTETLHCVRDAERIRDLGGAIPESQVEKLKREELALAKEKLQSIGNVLVEMEEDGNCLYRAWAYQIYGDAEKYHIQVRKECCQYIEANKGYFLHFIPDFDIEMSKKRKSGEWGDQIDIIAMSELYNVPVKIFQLNFEAKELTETSFGVEELSVKGITKLPQLKLCRHRETHYNAVVGTNNSVPFTSTERKGNHIRKIREDLEKLERKKSQENEDEKYVEAKEEIRNSLYMHNVSHSRRESYSSRSYPPRFSVTKVVLPGRSGHSSQRDHSTEIPSNIVLEED